MATHFTITTIIAFILVCFLNDIFNNFEHFNNFLISSLGVKYIITVKVGNQSPDVYEGNVGINIVARNFDTGFIKLDENIVVNPHKYKKTDENDNKNKFFRKNQTDVFQFEDQDIRTVIK